MRTSRSLTVFWGGGVPGPGGVYLVGGVPGQVLPPVNRMTNRCKNITLAKTSFRPVITWITFKNTNSIYFMPMVGNLFETQTGNLGLWSPVQIKGLGTHEISLQGIKIFTQTLIIQWANINFWIFSI